MFSIYSTYYLRRLRIQPILAHTDASSFSSHSPLPLRVPACLLQLPIVTTVLSHLERAMRTGGSAVAEKAIADIARSLVMDDKTYELNIYENLHALMPWHKRIPPIQMFMR